MRLPVPLPVEQLQLATLVDEPPAGDTWFHEQKLDGYRIVTVREGAQIELLSRSFKEWTTNFPSIAEAVGALACEGVVLDGEVCVVMPDGRTSFQALQNALSGDAHANLVYFVFDLLALDGESLVTLPLHERKTRLAKLLRKKGTSKRIVYCDHVVGNGAAFFELACKTGLEGIICKRSDQAYTPGRGKGWLKAKCQQRQELVIAGYTDPEGSRSGFGSLLLGYYDERGKGGPLRYAGKVGTGFSAKLLDSLRAQLDTLAVAKSPFQPEPARAWTGPRRHWVSPTLVGEVTFTEWTADGRLRHPSFQGLRADKSPLDVVRERPESSDAPKAAPRRARR